MRATAYVDRVGVSGPLGPDLDTLRRLHLAHRETFLFENLTIQSGGSIGLQISGLQGEGGGACPAAWSFQAA